GAALGALIAALDAAAPGRPVHLIAHSLGARVALAGIAAAPAGRVGRVIVLSPAEFRSRARAALAAPAARGAEVLAVTARANAPFDAAFAALARAPGPRDAVLGRGLPGVARWLDIDLDDGPTLAALATLGHRIAPPRARVCHWSGYLRPGAFGLYRHLLHDASGDGFARLSNALRRAAADAPQGAGLPPPVGLAPA
ncbi:MAG: hypothetical protein H5U20_08560, partial [Rhodobacteraceae bacterium]|nr:hypothetical protein [Paracoccaceae bacterium]